ncbi:pentapeptide repeat-containing protein [Paractinoplanes rishiriensis]|uniref:Pentapeptide repeat-containing protein n=1 Tax=Paractinoplanes rishiriensis TaxID=1050105 RepID=A0A919KA24_9ACTN|nr:pentapeptide repeat-containing protein [Actinoplanes rishiriensis]GIE99401.1 hypothetical protein Ari01nite_68660 [Actinoplanes rishiriensis]
MGRNRRNIALLLIGVVLAIAFLALVPALAHPPLSEADLRGISPERRIALQQAQAQLRDGMRASLLQAIAGVVIVLGAVATWRQVRVNQDGHLTAHFSRAVEHVGDDNLDVRIGGIYALERIARTSPEDLVTIVFMLTSFVRNNAPWADSRPTSEVDMSLPWLRVRQPAVQAALNVLGRHAAGRSEGRLYLPRTDLRSLQINDGADLSGANFNHANLARASLRGVILRRSGFKNCDLRMANLAGADLRNSDLRGAHLDGANLRGADLRGADLAGTDLAGADLTDARLDRRPGVTAAP